ncbi:MAG: hypothetical protein V4675_11040 [Verrucomicrobiota bacterium]
MSLPRPTGPQLTRFFLLGLPTGLIIGGVVAVFLFVSQPGTSGPQTSANSSSSAAAAL